MPRERVSLDEDDGLLEHEGGGGNYFADQESPLEFISSGAAVLDCTLGGGWPLTRIANIVGDESTGKTLLAVEASANFHQKFRKGRIFYREAESAFDERYAEALGMPLKAVDFIDPEKFVTIEDFYEDLCECVDYARRKEQPALYVVDSLDALSDKAEQKVKFDEGTYGTGKAKQMSKLFRMCKSKIATARMCLVIISQTRDKINSQFAAKTRSGGKALDFYSSQVLWLSHLKNIERTINGVERPVGHRIRAQCKKNKISLPYRECEFTITFGHGIDSMESSLDWLEEVNRLGEITDVTRKTYVNRLRKMDDEAYWSESVRVDAEVRRIWHAIEGSFLERLRPKYRNI